MAAAESLAEARSHNVPPETFLRHYREIRKCKQDHADTGMAVARAKKAAKGAGIDLDALKMLEKLADQDTDEAEMQLRHLRMYAQWAGLPIGSQLNFFGEPEPATVDAKAATEQREWDARDKGATDGKAGHERDTNPHLVGSAEHAAYDRGWLDGNKVWLKGQKQLAGELAANAKAGNGTATTRKRGRSANAH